MCRNSQNLCTQFTGTLFHNTFDTDSLVQNSNTLENSYSGKTSTEKIIIELEENLPQKLEQQYITALNA